MECHTFLLKHDLELFVYLVSNYLATIYIVKGEMQDPD